MGPSKKKALPTWLPLELKGNGRTYAGHAIVEEVLESLKSNAELGSATEACLARAHDILVLTLKVSDWNHYIL